MARFIMVPNLMEFIWASNIEHVSYGFVLGMNTRKETAFLKQIIREAARAVHEQTKKSQEKYAAVEGLLSLALTKLTDFLASFLRINNCNFNWDRMTSFDMGPYLQYAHVQLTSLTRENPLPLPPPTPAQIAAEMLAEQLPASEDRTFLLWTYLGVVRTAMRPNTFPDRNQVNAGTLICTE